MYVYVFVKQWFLELSCEGYVTLCLFAISTQYISHLRRYQNNFFCVSGDTILADSSKALGWLYLYTTQPHCQEGELEPAICIYVTHVNGEVHKCLKFILYHKKLGLHCFLDALKNGLSELQTMLNVPLFGIYLTSQNETTY